MAKKKMTADEFIKKWWPGRFPESYNPAWNSTITCADAADLLNEYCKYLESLP